MGSFVRAPLWFLGANQINLVAGVTFFYRMIFSERVPVPHLIYCQDTSALTEWADILQGGKDRLTYKLRTVFYSLNSGYKGFVCFERYNLSFFPHKHNSN